MCIYSPNRAWEKGRRSVRSSLKRDELNINQLGRIPMSRWRRIPIFAMSYRPWKLKPINGNCDCLFRIVGYCSFILYVLFFFQRNLSSLLVHCSLPDPIYQSPSKVHHYTLKILWWATIIVARAHNNINVIILGESHGFLINFNERVNVYSKHIALDVDLYKAWLLIAEWSASFARWCGSLRSSLNALFIIQRLHSKTYGVVACKWKTTSLMCPPTKSQKPHLTENCHIWTSCCSWRYWIPAPTLHLWHLPLNHLILHSS